VTAETIGALGSIISSTVIVVGAAAAVRQLRHLRASNEVTALQAIMESSDRADVTESLRFIQRELPEKLRDPAFVAQLAESPIAGEARAILPGVNFWERVGTFVILGAVSERSIMLLYYGPIVNTWAHAAPAFAILRRTQGPTAGENFEHLAVLATRWLEKQHPREARRLRRMPTDAGGSGAS
jgi:hypothetical protein